MVNHLLETSHPLSSSTLRLCGSVAAQSFHSQYTLPSSVSHNPFVCHSYENTGGVGGILPILGCADVSTFGPSDVSTFCRAIIGLAACASAKKASRE